MFFNLKNPEPKPPTGPIIIPKVFVDKHLATYVSVIFQLLFLMLNIYTVTMEGFLSKLLLSQVLNVSVALWMQADGGGRARESGMKILLSKRAGTLL